MRLKSLGLWFLVVSFCGCGGAVEEGPDGASGGSVGSGGRGNGTGTQPASDGGATPRTAKPTLGNCVPGTPRAKANKCSWIAKDVCYPSKEAACNCTCPSNVAEVYCLSDFPEPSVPTEVYCF